MKMKNYQWKTRARKLNVCALCVFERVGFLVRYTFNVKSYAILVLLQTHRHTCTRFTPFYEKLRFGFRVCGAVR